GATWTVRRGAPCELRAVSPFPETPTPVARLRVKCATHVRARRSPVLPVDPARRRSSAHPQRDRNRVPITKYGRSPWVDQFPRSRVPSYPKHKGTDPFGVVVIGGGLTGCATAYALAAAGVKTTLLGAEQIGRGATALSAGLITDDPGVSFTDLEKLVGLRNARRTFQTWRRSALDFAALLRRLEIRCALEPRTTVTVATTPDQLARLNKDQKARREAGLDAPLLNARAVRGDAPLGASAGPRTKEAASIDPYRACIGLAAAAAGRGP